MAFDSFFRCSFFVFHLWVSLSLHCRKYLSSASATTSDYRFQHNNLFWYVFLCNFSTICRQGATESCRICPQKLLQLLPLLHPSFPRSLPLSFSRFLQRGICIINCQQCHKIFSLVSFCFISLPSTSSSLLFFFVFRDSFVLFYFCFVVSSQNIFKIFERKGAQKETERKSKRENP